jgi:hypothetical protein
MYTTQKHAAAWDPTVFNACYVVGNATDPQKLALKPDFGIPTTNTRESGPTGTRTLLGCTLMPDAAVP